MASNACQARQPAPADVMHGSATDSVGLPLPIWGEGGGEGVTVTPIGPFERSKPLTSPLFLWEREQTELFALSNLTL
jgi:hypothetical protein